MKKMLLITALCCLGMSVTSSSYAEEPETAVSLSLGADVVSSYVWRGQELGAFSVQPSATLTFNGPGISLGAWASAELFSSGETSVNMREFDLFVSWSPVEALSIGVTDYYFCSSDYLSAWNFSSGSSHTLEANLGYDFGPVALSWNTVLAGVDHDCSGKRTYSTYAEISAPYKLAGVEGSLALGASLWDDSYTQVGSTGFKVCNIALTAQKELFKIPFMGRVVFNPHTDRVFFVVGLSF